MTTSDFTAQLDGELAWRTAEVNALKGAIALAPAASQDDLRKSLILVLYSHLEGFCVFALRHYVEAINDASIVCGDASPAVLAGAWEELFQAVLHGDKKCEVFGQRLPDDRGLHSHWRRRHFVEEIRTLEAGRVKLSEKVINAESNLKPVVLQRNMFVLGLDHTFVTAHEGTLNRFLGKRNRIAHGEERRGIAEREYQEYETLVQRICRDLIDFLTVAHRTQLFRKPPWPPVACG